MDSAWHSRDPRLDLEKFPAGLFRIENRLFDARGIIQLASAQMEVKHYLFPKEVSGIPVGLKANRIHFLHEAAWPAKTGTHIADDVIHYADQQQQVFPVIYGTDLRDWNIGTDPNAPVSRGRVAWSAWQAPFAFRVYETTWTNPLPKVALSQIDLVSRMESSALFVIAITVD